MKRQPHLVHFITSLEMGGAQAVLYDVVKNLSSFSHTVIYFHGGPYEEKFRQAGISIHRVRGLISCYDPLAITRLYTLIQQLNPDCLHTVLWAANWMGRIVGKMLGIPCVTALHNNKSLNGAVRAILDQLAPDAHTTIAVSDEVKRSFDANKIVVILNGVNQDAIHHQVCMLRKTRNDVGFTDDHFIVGSVGRLHPVKRYDLLIESVAHLYKKYSHIRLLIIGSGSEEKKLRDLIAFHNLNHVAKLVADQALGYYPLFDCFVQPSAQEGISMALLEAMSCGLPCVVTNASKSHPVIKDGQEGVVVMGEGALLSQGIELLMTNPKRAQQMGARAAQTIADKFDNKRMIAAYGAVFLSAAGTR